MDGSDDDYIEIGGGGGESSKLFSKYIGFVDSGWTLDETSEYIKATLNGDEESPAALEYKREFLKILAYSDEAVDDVTDGFELVSSYVNAIVRDLDMGLDVSVGPTDDSENQHYIRYQGNILTSTIDVSTAGFNSFPSGTGTVNYKDSGLVLSEYDSGPNDASRAVEDNTIKIEMNDIAGVDGPWYGVVLTASIVTIKRVTGGDVTTKAGTFVKFNKNNPVPDDSDADPLFIFNTDNVP